MKKIAKQIVKHFNEYVATHLPAEYFVPHKKCAECPFSQQSVRGWFGPYKAEDYFKGAMAESVLQCHMTTNNPGKERHCTGGALFRHKILKMPRHPIQAAHQRACVEKYGVDGILGAREFSVHHKMDDNGMKL